MKSKENVGGRTFAFHQKIVSDTKFGIPENRGNISEQRNQREQFKSLMKILGDQTKLKPEAKGKKIRGLNIRKFDESETRLKSQLQQHSARQFAA